MQVRYLNLSKQFDNEVIFNGIKDELRKSQFVLGPGVEEFESNFARLCNTPFAVGVNSGTDALYLCLKALDIGPGDEVITVPNSFIATTAVIVNAGARPVFVDVGSDYNINPGLIEKAITKKTKAILPVHLTGNPSDMPWVMEIARKYNLFVIEDASQAVGATIDNQPVGSFGITGCFSLHPLKNLNVCGDGGIVVTNSKELYNKLILLRNHGLVNRDEAAVFGYNSRLDTIQAVIANEGLKNLEDIINTRIRNAQRYDSAFIKLKEFITISPRRKNVRHVFHTYIIQVKDRDRLSAFLTNNGIENKIHYPIPIHLQKAARYLGYKEGDFPIAEAQARSIITLPVHQYLTEEEIDYVINTIERFYIDVPSEVKVC